MAYIYLLVNEGKMGASFKVGYTHNLQARMRQYATHNDQAQLISAVITQERSKRAVETAFHSEIKKMGYEFNHSTLLWNIQTEWFTVSYSDPFYTSLMNNGLQAFQVGKGRKEQLPKGK